VIPFLDNKTVADYYFDIDSSTFELWQELESANLIVGQAPPIIGNKSIPLNKKGPPVNHPPDRSTNEFKLDTFEDFVLSKQTYPIAFFSEIAIFAGQSIMLVGESGSGKSWTMNHIIGDQLQRYAENINLCPI
jgi:predicted NACHT family NTPase